MAGTGDESTAGIGATDGEPDPHAAPGGDRASVELDLTVGDDGGTDDGGADRGDDGRAGGGSGRAAGGSRGRAAGGKRGGVRPAGGGKRKSGGKRDASKASGTREASLRVDAKPAPRGA